MNWKRKLKNDWGLLGLKYKPLSDIANYVIERIEVDKLTLDNYISTENMISNKGGVGKSAKLPRSKTTASYKKGDVLISNIRPYFKKIWFSKNDGGCSNDILVLRAKEGIHPEYLYYVLSNESFFEYATATSKGTKMPRGDKQAIMKYRVPDISLDIQIKIADMLSTIDSLIYENNKINENLFKQAQVLYQQSFPYTASDYLPDGWRIGTVSEIIEIHDSKRIPLSGAKRNKMKRKIYPYYGAASLMDYVDEYIFDGKYLLLGEDGTVSDDAGFPILQYVWGKFWVNNHAHILTGKLGYNVESLYTLFSQTSVNSIITGAVQPKISQASLKSIRVVLPPVYLIEKFNEQIEPMFTLIRNNRDENKRLSALRDTLLPKLISGELNISKIKV